MPTDPTTPSARIPIVRMVSGSNGHPHSRKYEAVAHALIDKRDFEYLSKFVWTLVPHPTGMLYGRRSIWANKKSSFRSAGLARAFCLPPNRCPRKCCRWWISH